MEQMAEQNTTFLPQEPPAQRTERVKLEALRLFFYHLNPHDELSKGYAYSNRGKRDWEKVKTNIRTCVCDLMSSELAQNHLTQIFRTRYTDMSAPNNLITHYERSLDEFMIVLGGSKSFVCPGAQVITLVKLKDLLWQSLLGLYMPKENFRIFCEKLEKDSVTDLNIQHKDAFTLKGKPWLCQLPEYIDEKGEVLRAGQSVGYVSSKQRSNNDGGMGGSNATSVPAGVEKGLGRLNKDYTLPAGVCSNCGARSCKIKSNCTKPPYCGIHDTYGSHNVGDCFLRPVVPGGQSSSRGSFRGGNRGWGGRGRGGQTASNGGQQQPQEGFGPQPQPPAGHAGRQPSSGNYGGYPPVAPVERTEAPDYSGHYPDQQVASPPVPGAVPPPQGPP